MYIFLCRFNVGCILFVLGILIVFVVVLYVNVIFFGLVPEVISDFFNARSHSKHAEKHIYCSGVCFI